MKAVNLIQNLLFPPKCANCGELLDIELSSKLTDPLCPDCRLDFESEKERECNTCGLAMKFCRCMPRAMNRAQCTALLKLISYRNEDNSMSIRNFVYAIKHTYRTVNFSFVAENMRQLLISEMRAYNLMPEDCVITYLPRSFKNKSKDGFDQSLELARALSRATGIRFVPCLKRRFFTNEQKKLNRFERALNTNSAYKGMDVEDKIKNKTVILVDDIVTTGSSMASCARELYAHGAYAVMGVCLGYTEKIIKNKYQKH